MGRAAGSFFGKKLAGLLLQSAIKRNVSTYIRGSFENIIKPLTDCTARNTDANNEKKMRLLIVLAVVALVRAAPQNSQDVQILRYDVNNAGTDGYSFAWELSDGSKHEEQGQLKNQGTENEVLTVRGQYAWVGPDGVTYVVTYVADENGFQPTIEQGPGGGVPPAVVASLLG